MQLTIKSLLVASALLLGHSLFAQNYRWDDVPKLQAVSDSFKKESAVFLLEKRVIKYVPDTKNDDINVYRTVHRIIKLMDDKGVEYFNKMTISPAYGSTIQVVKGRTIKANGKVIDLKSDQIKTKANENGDEQYHLAFEGVEKGDVVEMYYTEKRPYSRFGIEMMQIGLPVEHASFTLEIPEFWSFDVKGFNGFPDAKDTVIGTKTRTYTSDAYKLDALEEETYSDLTPNLQRIEYKFSYTNDNKSRLYTWNDMVKNMYEYNYTFTEKEIKAVAKFLAPLQLDNMKKDEDKIIAIENAIKKNVVYDEKLSGEDYRNMSYILEKKTASESGIIRLFAASFQTAGIKHELGISSNRFEFPIDEKFENWLRPDIYVFGFPSTKQYLDPVANTLRYPMIPSAIRENNAIFCKTITVGSLTTALASVRKIPALDYKQSVDNLKADVTFDNAMVPTVNLTEAYSGYRAMGIREISIYLTKDKEKEFVQNTSGGIAQKTEDIKSYSFKNTGVEHYTDNTPVEVKSEIKAEQLMETAGDKLLFNVGDILGPQQQMYNEKKRKLPISFAFPHEYQREIIIHIPDGYKISNPEAVKIDAALSDDNMGFHSVYKIEGNTMTINITEYYKITSLPPSEVEPFKKVVNAAADFNKIVLIMVKK